MATYTNTIGTGSDFATLSLYWNTSATEIASGDVLVAEFLGGTHSIGATYNNTFSNLVGVDLVMRPVASAMHNGNWNEGVRIEPQTGQTGQMYFQSIGNQDFSLRVEDLVWINPNTEQGRIYVNFDPTLGSGAQYDATLSFERCLIHASGSNPYEIALNANNYDVSSGGAGVSALGNATISLKNCVIEGFRDNGDVTRCFRSTGTTNITYSAIGCTFQNATLLYSNTASAVENLHVHGCMFNQTGNLMQLGWEGFNTAAESTSSFSDIIWTRTDQASYVGDNWTTGASFNYDGTVTAGEVCFVGPSGPEGNYRLVSDVDNLAVRYMDLSSIVTARDVANVKRCGSTDAGAFQSVSDRVLSATIPTEYASFDVFAGALGVGEFLNGDTLHILYEDGVHNTFGNLYTTNLDHTAGREVDLNIIVEGENHHQGYWSSGAIFKAIGTMQHGRQTTSYLWKNIVIDNDNHPNWPYRHNKYAGDVTYQYGHYLNQYETDEVYDDTITFENCLIRMNANSFLQGKYDSSIDDRPNEHPKSDPNTKPLNYSNSLSNIVKAGTISTNYKNCAIESIIPGLAFDGFDVPFYQIRKTSLVGCSVKNIGLFGLTWPSESTVELSGCLIDTSGADHFITYGWHGSTYLEQQPHFTWTDCIFTDTSSNSDLFRSYSYQIPAGSGALENSIASGYINNCTFGVPFNYDNTITGGEVCFVGSANSSALDFRLVPTEDNLASGYVSSFALSGLDLASNSRGDSPYDAGAFAITPEQVEDYIKRLGGPLVLQVGYRISNNRQIFIPVIGGGE